MKVADGSVHKVIPIIAVYIANFPEQSLAASSMQSGCMMYKVPYKKRGDYMTAEDLAKVTHHAQST